MCRLAYEYVPSEDITHVRQTIKGPSLFKTASMKVAVSMFRE